MFMFSVFRGIVICKETKLCNTRRQSKVYRVFYLGIFNIANEEYSIKIDSSLY